MRGDIAQTWGLGVEHQGTLQYARGDAGTDVIRRVVGVLLAVGVLQGLALLAFVGPRVWEWYRSPRGVRPWVVDPLFIDLLIADVVMAAMSVGVVVWCGWRLRDRREHDRGLGVLVVAYVLAWVVAGWCQDLNQLAAQSPGDYRPFWYVLRGVYAVARETTQTLVLVPLAYALWRPRAVGAVVNVVFWSAVVWCVAQGVFRFAEMVEILFPTLVRDSSGYFVLDGPEGAARHALELKLVGIYAAAAVAMVVLRRRLPRVAALLPLLAFVAAEYAVRDTVQLVEWVRSATGVGETAMMLAQMLAFPTFSAGAALAVAGVYMAVGREPKAHEADAAPGAVGVVEGPSVGA